MRRDATRSDTFSMALRTALLLALAASLTAPAHADSKLTPKQIIAKYVQANGGRKGLEQHQQFVAVGDMQIGDKVYKGALTLYVKDPNKTLMIADLPGMGKLIHATGGDYDWDSDPKAGLQKKEKNHKEERDAKSIKSLLDLDAYYSKLELLPMMQIFNRAHYVIRMTPKQGTPLVRYFDAKTFMLTRVDKGKSKTGSSLGTSVYTDWRKADGKMTPFVVAEWFTWGDIVMRIAKLTPKADISDSIFNYPGK
jgi:hypothetical protein